MVTVHASLSQLHGIGPRFLQKFDKLGIKTVRDLLRHFPVRYEDWSDIVPIIDLNIGDSKTIQGIIEDVEIKRTWKKRMIIVEATITDATGSIQAIWFNQPYIKNILKKGAVANFAGKVTVTKNILYFSNPTYEVFPYQKTLSKNIETKHTGRLVPIYSETKGLTSKGIRFLMKSVLDNLEPIIEYIPQDVLEQNHLFEVNEALQKIHFPQTHEEAEEARARFAFEELFLLQIKIILQRQALTHEKAQKISITKKDYNKIKDTLPFELTTAQERSMDEILMDMRKPYPMNRLLQGDVGSGKTIVAGIAALTSAQKGCQVAFMAPTEILARQHYHTLKKFFSFFHDGIGLVVSKDLRMFYGEGLESTITKKDALKKIEEGKLKIIVGTHALIQKHIGFHSLGLVIIDEQHRFGVKQRAELVRKEGEKNNVPLPHFLSMSATPIPRTIMMTIFGDLDLSLIDELPQGRKEIITRIVSPKNRDNAYAFVRGQVRKGRQVFVVCPRIEPSEEQSNEASPDIKRKMFFNLQVKSVKEEYEKLAIKVFPDLRVAMLHGKMKSQEKDSIMKKFIAGDIDILVATSVIEVGVDVPNATIMFIEGTERFGLAQLYQFRGRVGRGDKQSFCLLFTDSSTKTVHERLQALITARNGFELAEKDLKLRGPGEFLGEEQTGIPDIAMRALRNTHLIQEARYAAEQTIQRDPSLEIYPLLKKKLQLLQKEVHFE
ncbi:MAG: ATP-dependent DNA helicase RecG [bacterium]